MVSVHMKEHLPLSRTRVEERIERNTNAQDSCVFRTVFNLLNEHSRELSCMCCIEILC